jgi:lysozyme
MALADKLKLTAILGTAGAIALVNLTADSEGVRTTPYQDSLGHNVWTVCYGDTGVPMRKYTGDECKTLLADRLAAYATAVRNMTPGFDDLETGVKVGLIDFDYNTGDETYRKSTLRKMVIAKQFPEACDQFLRYKYTNGKDCTIAANRCGGIIIRRQAERAACRGE